MRYEAWRASFQNSEQAARAAFDQWQSASGQVADQVDYPECDTCEKRMDYMPWHYATETERHLHACNECWPKVNPSQLQSAALVRYCYECGSVGEVDRDKHRNCCPDGVHAVYVPHKVAEQAREGFLSRIQPEAEAVARVTVSEAPGGYCGAYVGIEWLDMDRVIEGDLLYRGRPQPRQQGGTE